MAESNQRAGGEKEDKLDRRWKQLMLLKHGATVARVAALGPKVSRARAADFLVRQFILSVDKLALAQALGAPALRSLCVQHSFALSHPVFVATRR